MTAPVHKITPQSGNTQIRDTSGQDMARDVSGRKTWRNTIIALGFVAVCGLLVWVLGNWWSADAAVNAERLRFAKVERGSFRRDISAPGLVIAAVSPSVYAQSAGTVTLHVKAGDMVEQGATVATLSSPTLTSELAQERATLSSLETNLQRRLIEHKQQSLRSGQLADVARMDRVAAERELRRAEAAWKIRVISRQDLEKAQDDVERSVVTSDHANAAMELERESLEFELRTLELERDRQALAVENLQRQVGDLVVTAPVSGMVGTVAVAQKEAVNNNQPLLSIVDLTAFEVEARIAQSYAERLAPGMTATISYGNDEHSGILRAISPEVTNNAVAGRIRFDGDTPAGLRQNQRVTVALTLESVADALTLPRGAFVDSGAGRVIYVVDDNVATRRDITLGASSGGRVEVLTGLRAGEEVIVSSIETLRGAERVVIKR
ncbi:MAG: efflux RND transporter periplasmic adaptor subunit [Gammaproteobacteria bacterium]